MLLGISDLLLQLWKTREQPNLFKEGDRQQTSQRHTQLIEEIKYLREEEGNGKKEITKKTKNVQNKLINN